MKIGILTKEYPPYVYGGAGVHVASLVKELAKHQKVFVHCFGDLNEKKKNLEIKGYSLNNHGLRPEMKKFLNVFEAQSIALKMASEKPTVDLIHCHTWYTSYTGFLIKKLYNIPLVITMHSLEPLRPWKREQLGAGYDVSCWMERLAVENADKVIANSDDTKIDTLRCYGVSPTKVEVIYNGVDVHNFRRTRKTDVLKKYKIDPHHRYLLFVGRVTRQKGLIYFLEALKYIDKKIPVVICAGAPDEKNIYETVAAKIKQIRKTGREITHIEDFVDHREINQIFSQARVFVCPSIYEPFGMATLEAMACEVPVVASAVGGLPEFVIPEETGYLVAFKSISEIDHAPRNPENFSHRLANYINHILKNPTKARTMGEKGRQVAVKGFSWQKIARDTINLYKKVLRNKK